MSCGKNPRGSSRGIICPSPSPSVCPSVCPCLPSQPQSRERFPVLISIPVRSRARRGTAVGAGTIARMGWSLLPRLFAKMIRGYTCTQLFFFFFFPPHLCSFDFCPLGFVFTGKSLTPTFHACKRNRGKAVRGLFASRPCQKYVGTHGCSAEEGTWSRNYFLPPPTEEMGLERYTRSLIITAIRQPKMQHRNMKACLFHSLLHFYCL